jgi:hypothetical protein
MKTFHLDEIYIIKKKVIYIYQVRIQPKPTPCHSIVRYLLQDINFLYGFYLLV